ncbi:MAG: hypothetical protein FRX49_00062 [Trebouxia sp. A1-2]|nr:MAG: hypothetical protein FRX49_00062 [Trebouxia sp. A1-2]
MASSGLLAGKRCLVTGGNRGIGKAIAETFAREGASLALVARSKDKLEEVADSCQSQGAAACEIYPFDLVNTGDIDSLAKRILADKQVDVLVNNAGIMDGLIINVGSIAGLEPMKSTPVYAASKWGLRGWSLSCYDVSRDDATRQAHMFGRLSADVMATASNKLAGKWCVVTGGGAGIGQAIAETFAAEGASIALVARSKDKLEEVAKGCKSKGAPQVETHSVDLLDLQALDKFAKSFLSSHKHCDVLVNNAGMMGQGTPTEGDISKWEKCIQLNLLAPMALTHAFSPGMVEKKEGLIINMGSVAALEPMKSTPPTDIAEAAMLALRTSSACVPSEITLRLTLSAAK